MSFYQWLPYQGSCRRRRLRGCTEVLPSFVQPLRQCIRFSLSLLKQCSTAPHRRATHRGFAGRKIKVLFVGGLSQRKGISYFFDAIKGLENDLEVTVVGSGNINNCKVLKKALSNVNYIPSLPHEQILALMAAHDLFIFPSLFEGFGLVITEAMSQGTPVITTCS